MIQNLNKLWVIFFIKFKKKFKDALDHSGFLDLKKNDMV